MSYQVFARKYRPRTFEEILGQEHVVRTLRNAITQNRLAHAYLFVGPRGTGKTSTARILAKALNCSAGPRIDFNPDEPICVEIAEGRSMDVLEIDGASNNGIDQVRDLRDTVRFAPMKGQFRIIYIDEVHMLSPAAFNGLLKVLEEPPPHAKFIFATTEPQKILPTIISRCQRFDLRRIPDTIIADHLLHIAALENIRLDVSAAHAIARGAEGGMRDSQSMLDQLVAFCGEKITEEDVLTIFGFTAQETIASLSTALLRKETAAALEQMHQQADLGKDLTRLLADLIAHFRNLLVHKIDPSSARDLAPHIVATLADQAPLTSPDRLINLIDQFADVDSRMKWSSQKRLFFEIGIIKAIRSLEEVQLSDVIVTLKAAGDERKREGGVPGGPESRESGPVVGIGGAKQAIPANAPAAEADLFGGGVNSEATGSTTESALPAGAELWRRTVAELMARKPIQGGYAAQGVFLEQRGSELVIGFAPASQIARESLNRPAARTAVEEILLALSGEVLALKLEIRADVTPPAPPPHPSEFRPAQADSTTAASSAGRIEVSKPGPARTGNEKQEAPVASEADFFNDPLIAEAISLFEAKIVSVKPGSGATAKA